MSASRSSGVRPGIHKAVIPAAGLGTRLRPLSYAFPKELLPVGRKPVLAHIAAELQAAGVTDALFIVSERKPQIRSFFGDAYRDDTVQGDGLRCAYALQEEQRGLGDALLRAEEWAGDDPFVVAFGDCMIDAPDPAAPLRRLIATHREQSAGATVLNEEVARDRVSRYGVLAPMTALNGRRVDPFAVEDIVEKPRPEEAPSTLVVAARWVLDPTIFAFLKSVSLDARGELNLTDAVRNMRRAGGGFWAVPLRDGEFRRDIGNFETFYAAFVRAALRDPEFGEATRRIARAELDAADAGADDA